MKKYFISPFQLLSLAICLFQPMAYAYNPEHLEAFIQTKTCEACDLNNLNADPQTLGHSQFINANLKGSYFYGSVLEGLNLQYADMKEITAVGLLLHEVDLTHADLSYSDLGQLKITAWTKGDYLQGIGSFLKGADFSYTSFQAPNFFQAYLGAASLYRIIWPEANLAGANLQGADLSFAQLQGANLQEANFSGAVLSRANLSNANLLNANITENQLKQCKSLRGAILPNGEVSP